MSDLDPALTRPNCFEIDLDAIAHNVGEVRRIVGPETQIFAALKANAYGFGLRQVAEVVLASGVDAVALADLSDAILLRAQGVRAPILLYGGNLVDADVAAALSRHEVMPTLLDDASAEVCSRHAAQTLRVFVEVDVGLERLGIAPEETLPFVKRVRQLPKLTLHGVYTHMRVSAAAGSLPFLEWQFRRFEAVIRELEAEGIDVPVRMAASSGVLRLAPQMKLNAVDPGHLLFGLTPPGPATVALDLRPAFHALKSRLIQTKPVRTSEFLDQAAFPIRAGMRLGIVPIGLRDGLASLTCGQALVRGQRVSILGTPSLEHTRLDLTAVPQSRVGDEVVIIGRQGTGEISPREVIEFRRLKVAELALSVRESIARRYLTRRKA